MATISNRVILFENDIPPMKLRAQDEAEVRALGLSPEEAIKLSWSKSNVAFAVYFHGELGAMWGLRRMGPVADIWLLTTEAVDTHPISFVGESRRLMFTLLQHFEILRCEVFFEYTRALSWLKLLGFTQVGEGHNFGFITMEKRR